MATQLEDEVGQLRARVEKLSEENATLWARLEIAEPSARDATELRNKLEMRLESVRDERDEARQELKEWLKTHPPSVCSRHLVLDLKCEICNSALHQLEQARATCAEMRSVLSAIVVPEADAEKVKHALSAEAGIDWISPTDYRLKMEELQRRLVAVLAKHV